MRREEAYFRPTWAEINLDHLIDNYRQIRNNVAPATAIMAVVKADAYGHGLRVAQVLYDEGVRDFAVSSVDEGVELRGVIPPDTRILILGYAPVEAVATIVKKGLTPTIIDLEFAKVLSDYAVAAGFKIPVHVKVDTGMNRIGFDYRVATDEIFGLVDYPGIEVAGIFTHFATADERDKSFTQEQVKRFAAVVDALTDKGLVIPLRHASNSAGVVDLPQLNLNLVRPGIILYGHYPSDEVMQTNIDLKPVMSLKTCIVQTKTLAPGDTVSYGRHFAAQAESKTATLPLGYADGYSRMLSGKGTTVWLRDQEVSLIGNVCMDQCMIDITGLDGVESGEVVELFGEHLPAERLAEILGTIPYEICCMIGKRVPRVNVKNGIFEEDYPFL